MTVINVVLTLGALAGAGGSIVKFWPTVGWVTPSQVEVMHDHIEGSMTGEAQQILDAIGKLNEKIDDNHLKWLCDEDREELYALLEKQEAGRLSVEERERVAKLRDNLANDTCGDE